MHFFCSISVRLGEYDLSKTIDCNPKNNATCNNYVINIAPERIFKHENYSKSSYQYDIALIKLSKDVEFHGKLNFFMGFKYILTKF